MHRLSENEFKTTFGSPMRELSPDSEPPFDFWDYVDAIPVPDFEGYTCRGDVTYVWENSFQTFQHVLLNSEDVNVFMVIVLDVVNRKVHGHHLLNLNVLYGLDENA